MSTNKRSLWWAIGIAWAVLLLGLGVWSSMRSPATVREQSPIGSAKTTVDRVVGQVGAGLPGGWRADDSGYRESGCSITPMRDGVAATRTLTLSGPEGSEGEALGKLASGFDGVRQRPDGGFFYDAGDFVALRARPNGPGVIVVELKTGCRPTH